MNAESYVKLESQLSDADEIFSWHVALNRRALEIRNELRALIAKVVTERIRAEEAECRSS